MASGQTLRHSAGLISRLAGTSGTTTFHRIASVGSGQVSRPASAALNATTPTPRAARQAGSADTEGTAVGAAIGG